MFGYVSAKTHAADLAAKDALIDSLDKTAAFYKRRAEAFEGECRYLNQRLQALTPARGQGGRFVGKAVSNG